MTWSEWLTVSRAALRYGLAEETIRKLKGKGGIRWSKPPGLGLLFYAPDIDRYIESCVSELARKLHQEAVRR